MAEDNDSTIHIYFIHSSERGSRGFIPHNTDVNPMISEGSCGTEDWGNDAGNRFCRHREKIHLIIN